MTPERSSQPLPGVVRFYNFLPQGDGFLADVLAGLSLPQKSLPPKYFYDERGSRLFEAICELPEYYPTRTELAIMRDRAGEMSQFIGPDAQLIELGSGAGTKTRILLDALRPPLYVPIDIACETLQAASQQLAGLFPALHISGVCADYTLPLMLPEFVGLPLRRKAIYFPGSTIGNFTPDEALQFLHHVRRMAGTGGVLLIGVDLKKDRQTLEAAYDDAQGVTAQFNLNLLDRINRELGADFEPKRFGHKAFYDPVRGWIEMHLESRFSQVVHVGGRRFEFDAGETLHTEISCKYSVEEFQALARKARFSAEHVWTDENRLFSVHGMMAI
jgi:dimethylhistidine N-methyltransferase